MPNNLTLSAVSDILCRAQRVLICIHHNPDGDAAGSAFALAQMLRAMDKYARVICADPIPKRLRFTLREQEEWLYTEGMETEYDLLCAVDTASVGQLGALGHLADKIGVSIDHHGTGEVFCPAYVDPAASAAGEILFDLYRMWCKAGQLQPDADIARLLYTAIVSDTGSFKYSNTTKKTMLAAAELMGEIQSATDGGDDVPMLCHRLFECRTMTELRAQRAGIDALRLEHKGELGIVLFTQQMLTDNGLTMEDIANVIGLPRTVDGVKIALAVKQSPDDPTTWRISSRANVDVDVSAVCATFGGGGHKRAAGCSISAPDAEAALAIAIEAFGGALTQAEGCE